LCGETLPDQRSAAAPVWPTPRCARHWGAQHFIAMNVLSSV